MTDKIAMHPTMDAEFNRILTQRAEENAISDQQRFIEAIFKTEQLIEVRVIRSLKDIRSGYYTNRAQLLKDVAEQDIDPTVKGIYVVMNEINSSLLRERTNQDNRIARGNATSKDHIIRRRWLVLDFDPIKEAGTPAEAPSTNAEKNGAVERAQRCEAYLTSIGFPEPIRGDSGNGAHLIYRIDMPNDQKSYDLVASVLDTLNNNKLDKNFGVDVSLKDAPRVCKLYGTMSRKGENTSERPHRRSRLLSVPIDPQVVTEDTMRVLVDRLSETGRYKKSNTGIGRHPVLLKIVTARVAQRIPFPKILEECVITNTTFTPPKSPDVLEAEVKSLYEWVEKAETKKDTEKRQRLLPGGIITPEMKKIIETNHPNVSIAHCLNMLIGMDAPDGGVIRWNAEQEAWFYWDGKIWVKDIVGQFIVNYAEDFLFKAMADAATANNKSFILSLMNTQSVGNVRGAMFYLQGMVSVKDNVFDADNSLFNVQNGTVDLNTGELFPFNKTDYITRIGNVDYVKDATAPKWTKHLSLVIPNDDTRKAFQYYIGYTMMGGNSENTALFLYGGGKNGKTETTLTITHLYGTYSLNSQPQAFYERINDDSPRPDIARMKGARFISIPEGRKGKQLDEGLFKQLTGGDVVTARYLYGREFDFIPTGSLVFFTNHLPKISGRDVGVWRRIFPIPFKATIPKENRIKDYHKILVNEEASGILNWMLKGLKLYQDKNELFVSQIITDAKSSYKDTEDVLSDFMSGYIITEDEKDKILRSDLYKSYKLTVGEDRGVRAYGRQKFNDLMSERLGDAVRFTEGYRWVGIRVRKDGEVPQTTMDTFS